MFNITVFKSRYTFLLTVGAALLLGALFMAACTSLPAGAPAARTAVATKIAEATKVVEPTKAASEAMTETTAMTTTAEMTKTEAATTPALKIYKDTKLGDILVDENDMVLYVFDKDVKDKSNCTGDCLKNWPALTVADEAMKPSAESGVKAELGVITRDDGTYQVTVNGMPVYHYIKDTKADETNGQGVGDVWWVIGADGAKVTVK